MKQEHLSKMLETNETATRRDFLKKTAGVVALFVLPVQYCSDDPGGNDVVKEPCISFEINFSQPMNRASVEGALGIEPAVEGFFSGAFTWSNGDATVYYKGNVPGLGQMYTVTIAGTAMNLTGDFLDGNADGTGGDPYSLEVPGV